MDVLFYFLAAVALQFLRTDYSFMDTPELLPAWPLQRLAACGLLCTRIHLLAAAVALIATSFDMLLQSWRFRQDPVWRKRYRPALQWAAFEFLVLLIYALAHIPANGFMEKLTIVLILLWLGQVAVWLSVPRRV